MHLYRVIQMYSDKKCSQSNESHGTRKKTLTSARAFLPHPVSFRNVIYSLFRSFVRAPPEGYNGKMTFGPRVMGAWSCPHASA